MLNEFFFFFFQAEDGIRDRDVTGVQTCALPISCWPKNCDGAIALPGVAASNWYGGRATTTTSPLREGCSESLPSTSRSSSFFMTLEMIRLPGLDGSLNCWKAPMIWFLTAS